MCRVQNLLRTVVVLLAATSQLLPPAADWFHPVCSHSVQAIDPGPESLVCATSAIAHGQRTASCHQHHSVCSTGRGSSGHHHRSETRSDSDGCTNNPSSIPHERPDTPHDRHECPICRVLFAAQVNVEVTETPSCSQTVPLVEPLTVPVDHILPRFELPVRGPPVV